MFILKRHNLSSFCTDISLVFQDLSVLPSEFYILTALSSWATCNPKGVPSKEEPPSDSQKDDSFETSGTREQHPETLVTKETVEEKKIMEK